MFLSFHPSFAATGYFGGMGCASFLPEFGTWNLQEYGKH